MQSPVFQASVNHSEEIICRMLQAVNLKYQKPNIKIKVINSVVKQSPNTGGYVNSCLVRNVEGSRKCSEGLFLQQRFRFKIFRALF
jgi:hypothetical protein